MDGFIMSEPSTAGFYRVATTQNYLIRALTRLATPSGTFYVEGWQGGALPDGWQYFASEAEAELALGTTMPPPPELSGSSSAQVKK
jgi:hypothetical protein